MALAVLCVQVVVKDSWIESFRNYSPLPSYFFRKRTLRWKCVSANIFNRKREKQNHFFIYAAYNASHSLINNVFSIFPIAMLVLTLSFSMFWNAFLNQIACLFNIQLNLRSWKPVLLVSDQMSLLRGASITYPFSQSLQSVVYMQVGPFSKI